MEQLIYQDMYLVVAGGQWPYLLGLLSNWDLHAAEHKYTFLPLASETCFAVFSSTIILHTGSLNIAYIKGK
jgi:hypothetical protein